MAFNVQYSFNNGAITGIATSVGDLRLAMEDLGINNLTQCTLSGNAGLSLIATIYETDGSGGYNVTNTPLFSGCSSLTSLDVSNLDTSKVTNMAGLFGDCTGLTRLDLSSFDTSNVTTMDYMFSGCSSLTSIKVSKKLWDTNKLEPSGYSPAVMETGSTNMFNGCTSLPNYNSSSVDKTKAIDKSLGGYLDVVGNDLVVDLFTTYQGDNKKIHLGNNYISVTRKVGKYGI